MKRSAPALGAAALLAAVLPLGAGTAALPAAALGAAGVAVLAMALRSLGHGALATAVLLLAAAYIVRVEIHRTDLDLSAPLVAGGLALVAELGSWAVRARAEPAAERAVIAARAGTALGVALGGAACAGLVLAAATVHVGASPAITAVGAAAAALLLLLAAAAAR